MKWNEVSLTTSHDAAEAAANIFFEVGAQGVVIEDPCDIDRYIKEDRWDYYDLPLESYDGEDVVVIKGYLPADAGFSKSMEVFSGKVAWLQECFTGCSPEVSVREMAEEDWASSWKQFYKTAKIGHRVVIQPQWEEYNPGPGEIVVKMDPGAAFGTGTHATTMMCVRLLEKYLVPDQIVFDVGCGSGILSAVAAKLGARFVLARDIDPAAIHAARNNAKLNGIAGNFEAESGFYLDGVPGQADLIVCNIVSSAIIEFSQQAYNKLLPGGFFIVSGIISNRRDEVETKLKSVGFSLLETLVQNEWISIAAQKV